MFSKLIDLGFYLLWAFALFNPWFRKYDYGGGWPLVIMFAFYLLIPSLYFWRKKLKGSAVEHGAILLFVLTLFISFAFSQTKNTGFSEALAFSSGILFYLLYAFRENKFLERFLKIIALSSVLVVFVGLVFYLFQDEPRLFGTFFNLEDHSHKWPNAFALFVLMCWPLLFLFKSRCRYVLFGLLLSGLFLSYSRGAFIAFGGQIFLLLILHFRAMKKRVLVGGVLALLLAVGLFFGANYLRALNHEVVDLGEKVSFGNEEKMTSVDERADFISGALQLIKEKPLFGWGPFSFFYAYNGIQKTFLGTSNHPHNVFLKIGAEEGVPAMLLFVLIILWALLALLKNWHNLNSEEKSKNILAFVALAGALAHNMIDYNFNFLTNLWLFFALLAYLRLHGTGPAKANSWAGSIQIFLAILLALIAVFEGSLMVLSKYVDSSYYDYSFYPRNHYLTLSDQLLHEGKFKESEAAAQEHLRLNPLEAQAWYLLGTNYFNKAFDDFNLESCARFYLKALQLNGMNDLDYYVRFLSSSEGLKLDDDFMTKRNEMLAKAISLTELYFDYVQNNVHYTAYTKNVESAYELVNVLLPYLDKAKREEFLAKREEMLSKAETLREEAKRTF